MKCVSGNIEGKWFRDVKMISFSGFYWVFKKEEGWEVFNILVRNII